MYSEESSEEKKPVEMEEKKPEVKDNESSGNVEVPMQAKPVADALRVCWRMVWRSWLTWGCFHCIASFGLPFSEIANIEFLEPFSVHCRPLRYFSSYISLLHFPSPLHSIPINPSHSPSISHPNHIPSIPTLPSHHLQQTYTYNTITPSSSHSSSPESAASAHPAPSPSHSTPPPPAPSFPPSDSHDIAA